MYLIFKTLLFTLGLILVPLNNLVASSDIELTIVTEDLAPYQLLNADGEPDGYAVKIVENLLREAELTAEIKILPWTRTIKLATTEKNVLIFSLARTKEREDDFHWIGKIYEEKYVLLKTKDNDTFKDSTYEEIKNLSVAVARDSVADELITRLGFSNITRVGSFSQTYKMLSLGRVDLIVETDDALKVVNPYLTQEGISFEVFYEFNNHPTGLYIAMSKGSDPQLIERLTTAFNKIADTDLFMKLAIKWNI